MGGWEVAAVWGRVAPLLTTTRGVDLAQGLNCITDLHTTTRCRFDVVACTNFLTGTTTSTTCCSSPRQLWLRWRMKCARHAPHTVLAYPTCPRAAHANTHAQLVTPTLPPPHPHPHPTAAQVSMKHAEPSLVTEACSRGLWCLDPDAWPLSALCSQHGRARGGDCRL